MAFDNVMHGTNESEMLEGTVGSDLLWGLGGDDTLMGGAGDDWLSGGMGADEIHGGEGSDWAVYLASAKGVTVSLRPGANINMGGDAEGDELIDIENIYGSMHGDHLIGSGRANKLVGGAGRDLLQGGAGDDMLRGGDGDDELEGGAGNDSLFGDKGSDILSGEDGHDVLWGGKENDILDGGDGNDTLEGGFGKDDIDGGDGMDTVQYSRSNEAVTVDLGTGMGTGGHADGDTLEGIEGVTGSMHGDMLTLGDDMGGTLMGYKGDDTLTGGAMADKLMGGMGNDTLMGGKGDDTLSGDMGNDMLMGGMGNDMLYASDGEDTLDGGENAAGEDPDMDTVSYKDAEKGITVNASQTDSTMVVVTKPGSATADNTLKNIEIIQGSPHADTIAANQDIDLSADDVTVNGIMLKGFENATGGSDGNMLTGNDMANVLMGGGGNDTLDGGDGADMLQGGDDADDLTGGEGADTLYGGKGVDTINGGADDDMIVPGLGIATGEAGAGPEDLSGGAGGDTFMFGAFGTDDDGIADPDADPITRSIDGTGAEAFTATINDFEEDGGDTLDISAWGGVKITSDAVRFALLNGSYSSATGGVGTAPGDDAGDWLLTVSADANAVLTLSVNRDTKVVEAADTATTAADEQDVTEVDSYAITITGVPATDLSVDDFMLGG